MRRFKDWSVIWRPMDARRSKELLLPARHPPSQTRRMPSNPALPPRGDGRVALQCVAGYGVSAGQRHNSRPAVTLILALTRVAKSGPQASAPIVGVVPREFARTPGTGSIPAQKRGQIRHHSGVPERNFVYRSEGWRSGEDFLVHVSSCRLHTPGQFLLRERRS